MPHTTRRHTFGALSPFVSLVSLVALASSPLLLAACGGNPEVASDQSVSSYDSGATPINGQDSGGPDLNVDGGNDAGNQSDADTTAEAGPTCGDGMLDPGEGCDDNNTKPGDGCDGNCQKEPGYDCVTPGAPCTPTMTPSVCGNGIVEADEGCDLGDPKNDGTAGCDDKCQPVDGWTCAGTGAPCTRDPYCGDGIVQNTLAESCDDGTNDGAHGCGTDCKKQDGYNCPPTGGACSVAVQCGNGVLNTGEQCDDHNHRSLDGCSITCLLEAGFSCPAGGGACSRLCGNSKLDPGETCDDGNFLGSDGCSTSCQRDPDYTCVLGQPCVFSPPPPPAICGNGVIETGELCDDGNASGGDGCSSSCKVENGWKCGAQNTPCTAFRCGDGVLAGSEKCDDGNGANGDGCSSVCAIEPNANCPANGGACVPMTCGDGKVTGTETCDAVINDGKHGCSATCQVIAGWECPLAGTQCIPVCGDGLVVGDEQCDERGDVPCCSATCKLKPGFVCDPSKNPHSQDATPYCSDGIVDGPSNPTSPVRGSEQCDDHNKLPFDGCSPTCTNEPLCGTKNTSLPGNPPTVPFQCFALCGDGIVLPPEECDDGNAQSGDGCDSTCKVEKNPLTNQPAWTCVQPPPGASLTIPVIWRDFTPKTHPQFSVDPLGAGRRLPGMVLGALAQVPTPAGSARPFKYIPAYDTAFASPAFPAGENNNQPDWTMNGPGWVAGADVVLNSSNTPAALTTGAAISASFAQWFVDDPINLTFASTLTLAHLPSGAFQYSCAGNGTCDSSVQFGTTDGFFPLDDKGWVAMTNREMPRLGGPSTKLHNFSFTTEARYWFAFKGGEQLSFYGDDDVWVFVNGQLALDIGGIHSQTKGQFTLAANGVATTCVENLAGDGGSAPGGNCTNTNLGLTVGSVYEIDVFNAERHIFGSNFQLTLQGFNGAPSVCTPICGDGFVVGTEQCDRGKGPSGNVPPTGNTYGGCTTDCKLGPYCGDNKLLSPPEICDNGLNIDVYVNHSPAAQMCAPGCVEPAFCGDKVIQTVDGEECDDGTGVNQNTYGHCQTNCKLGARCGDGSVSNGEACDDGANNGAPSSACTTGCKKKCGDGTVEPGEQCDPAADPNALCDTKCRLKCGNGQIEKGEVCDDGKNDGSYGTCKADCTRAPFCGDGTQDPQEACDKGNANTPDAYGVGSCTDECLPGGICGDGLINGTEKCDDGQNTGLPGSCTGDCSAYIPTTSCGDHVIQPPEKCDDGPNGSATCDKSCRLKCGDAVVEAGEQCDNGVNDGSYGTCTSTCHLAGYCGDGIKNGNEQCDNGAANLDVKHAYGPGVCTTACLAAPFCGDGHVQAAFGEACEGNDLCSNCQSTVPR